MTSPILSINWFRKKEPLIERATDTHETPAPVYQLSPETRSKLLAAGIARTSEVGSRS